MFIRHAEKPTGGESGVLPSGETNSESLTVKGWTRAGALPGLFAPRRGRVVAGLARPGDLFASKPGANGSRRSAQTIAPLAQALGLTVDTMLPKSECGALAAAVLARTGDALVSWQHELIPEILRQFPHVRPAPPTDWPDDRFDLVWVLRGGPGGWTFSQVAQLLLPDDSAQVIV